jgi:hypothetical protein
MCAVVGSMTKSASVSMSESYSGALSKRAEQTSAQVNVRIPIDSLLDMTTSAHARGDDERLR